MTTDSPKSVRLGRDTIIGVALELAAAPGVGDLTFRELGRALGVDHTALYRHFPSKQSLMWAAFDQLVAEVESRLQGERELGWREFLEQGAITFHDVFVTHPSLAVHAMEARDVGPAELRLVDRILRSLSEAGLSGESLLAYYGAYSSLVLSLTAMAAKEEVSAAINDDTVNWVPTREPLSAATHPHLFPVWNDLATLSFRDSYIACIAFTLDAIESAPRP